MADQQQAGQPVDDNGMIVYMSGYEGGGPQDTFTVSIGGPSEGIHLTAKEQGAQGKQGDVTPHAPRQTEPVEHAPVVPPHPHVPQNGPDYGVVPTLAPHSPAPSQPPAPAELPPTPPPPAAQAPAMVPPPSLGQPPPPPGPQAPPAQALPPSAPGPNAHPQALPSPHAPLTHAEAPHAQPPPLPGTSASRVGPTHHHVPGAASPPPLVVSGLAVGENSAPHVVTGLSPGAVPAAPDAAHDSGHPGPSSAAPAGQHKEGLMGVIEGDIEVVFAQLEVDVVHALDQVFIHEA